MKIVRIHSDQLILNVETGRFPAMIVFIGTKIDRPHIQFIGFRYT